ncbi:M61 family metallopeptidase [Ningiella sp. W23]|uniref:M61 family metallopeptidase n=1 Tax=Ningiella sp. W23 TaxID=3023715 RepID=UPI003757884A
MTSHYITYQITPIDVNEHLFEVLMHAQLPEFVDDKLIVSLPAWIPGSYMIRDFARNIIQIDVQEQDLALKKLDKQTWQLNLTDTAKESFRSVTLKYRIFAYDLSVRSAYINHEYAFFNGTSTMLQVNGHESLPHYMQLLGTEQTQSWKIATAMPCLNYDANTGTFTELAANVQLSAASLPDALNPNAPAYLSDNYDMLIDHPVLMGNLCMQSFEVLGVTFNVVFTGEETMDLARICEDLKPICEHHIKLFGECPVKEYWFMTLLCANGYGGLEHKSSTVLQFARFDLPMAGDSSVNDDKSEQYQQFLSLCSHELFHTWHVKRIKPYMMVTPDLSQESYTPQLWIYEGFTSLYDDLTLARTSLISPLDYCQILGKSFTRLMRNPGRHLQSISESSFDAWTRFYKQDASSTNHIVSYYLKGSLVALALDITLRQQSNSKYCLDDVMRILWEQAGKQETGTLDDVISKICKTHFSLDIESFLHVAVSTTMDMPFNSIVNGIGLTLHMRAREHNDDKGGKPVKQPLTRDIGAQFEQQSNGLKVTQVLASSAAAQSGIQLNDVIVASNGFKANYSLMTRQLANTKLGSAVKLHVMRDEQLIEINLIAKPPALDTCYLTIEDEGVFKQWLGIDKPN